MHKILAYSKKKLYLCTLNMRKSIIFIVLIAWLSLGSASAQVSSAGRSVFSFMSLPTSSRINALGGSNVSLSDADISMGMCNPALLHNETHMVLQLNYSYYLPGTMFGSALYGHNFRDIQSLRQDGAPERPNYFAVGVHYLDYGTMKYADEYGNITGGKFGARDILIDVMYARQLHPCWKVGVTLKPVYSIYESYSSFAIGADVGAHFQTPDSTFQMGLVLANIGWQLKGFYSAEGGSNHEMLPLNLQLGLTYRVKHAPLRFHVQGGLKEPADPVRLPDGSVHDGRVGRVVVLKDIPVGIPRGDRRIAAVPDIPRVCTGRLPDPFGVPRFPVFLLFFLHSSSPLRSEGCVMRKNFQQACPPSPRTGPFFI